MGDVLKETMDNKQKKDYILKNWKLSSGGRISEMLRRYWNGSDQKKTTATQSNPWDIFMEGEIQDKQGEGQVA